MKMIRICCGTGCLANGSALVAEELEKLIAASGADVQVEYATKRTDSRFRSIASCAARA